MLQVMCSWSPMFTHPVLQFLFISFCAIQCTAHVCCTGSMIYAWCIVYKAKFFLWRAHKCTAPLAGWHGACLALIPILRLIDPTPTHRSPHTPNLPPPWWCNQAWTLPRLAHALQWPWYERVSNFDILTSVSNVATIALIRAKYHLFIMKPNITFKYWSKNHVKGKHCK